jgi:hypothetical protein
MAWPCIGSAKYVEVRLATRAHVGSRYDPALTDLPAMDFGDSACLGGYQGVNVACKETHVSATGNRPHERHHAVLLEQGFDAFASSAVEGHGGFGKRPMIRRPMGDAPPHMLNSRSNIVWDGGQEAGFNVMVHKPTKPAVQ